MQGLCVWVAEASMPPNNQNVAIHLVDTEAKSSTERDTKRKRALCPPAPVNVIAVTASVRLLENPSTICLGLSIRLVLCLSLRA